MAAAVESIVREESSFFQWAYRHFQREFIAGGCAGSVGIFVGFPFDLIKVRLQNESQLYPSSAIKCFQKTVREEGFLGFYRGCLPPICTQGFINALIFAGESAATKLLEPALVSGYLSLTANQYIAGCFGGLVSCFMLVPAEVIKCGMQISTTKKASNSWVETTEEVRKIYRSEGIRGFYKGFNVTACREIPSMGLYFLTYKKCREGLSSSGYVSNDVAIGIAGGCAGCASWIAIYPLDVIKTNIQISPLQSNSNSNSNSNFNTNSMASQQQVKRNAFDVAMTMYRKHGFSVFYRGVGVCTLRAIPVNCVTFYVYEYLKRSMNI
eukprot:gene33434-43214_t